MARKETLGITVRRQKGFHLLSHVRIIATMLREKRRTLSLWPCKGAVEEREDVFPTVGDHS
jgi:hypothetical protein